MLSDVRLAVRGLRKASVLLVAGAAIGLVLSISAVRPLADLMPDGVDAWDPRLFAFAAAALLATGLAAAALPARRAARVDPAVALREDG